MMFEHMRSLRQDRDLSQADLAQYLHVHQTTYSDYELGNVNIPPASLIKLALFYDTSVDYLIDFTDERTPYPRRIELE